MEACSPCLFESMCVQTVEDRGLLFTYVYIYIYYTGNIYIYVEVYTIKPRHMYIRIYSLRYYQTKVPN